MMQIREQLQSMAEPAYRNFAARLLPGIPVQRILGVRLPKLRRLAKEITQADWRAFCDGPSGDSLEEVMLQGMVIGAAPMPLEEVLERVRGFLPRIDNWSVCDSFCAGLQAAKRYPEPFWELSLACLDSPMEYVVRFGVVMLICHFKDLSHLAPAMERLQQVRSGAYYVQMAVAWAVSAYFIAYPDQTAPFLQHSRLDAVTYPKAVQKICDSRQVNPAVKRQVRAWQKQKSAQQSCG